MMLSAFVSAASENSPETESMPLAHPMGEVDSSRRSGVDSNRRGGFRTQCKTPPFGRVGGFPCPGWSERVAPRLTAVLGLLVLLLFPACTREGTSEVRAAADPRLQTNGTVEVTAKLMEIKDGAIFKRELYDYATVLKYQVLKVQRGRVSTNIIYVGQYNPFKPRAEAADARVPLVGGNLREFRAGQVHHMAMDAPIEDRFMGGIVNKYFGQTTDPIYWAIWTDLVND